MSFIVPAYNSERTIGKCLVSVEKQRVEKEIIVVDGGSKDNTRDFVKKFGARLIVLKRRGIAPARNAGLREARGGYIAFVDSDVVLPEGWIGKALKRLEKKGVGGVGGPGISIEKSVIADSLNTLLFGRSSIRRSEFVDSIATMDVLYRKEAVNGVWFDEDLMAGEDPEFNLQIKKRGWDLFFDRDLWVYHHHPLKLGGLLRKWYNYGKSRPLMAKKRREFRNPGFFSRLLYIPFIVGFGLLSFLNIMFLYLLVLQLGVLFFLYFYIGLRTCKGLSLLVFPFIHTMKQFAHMAGFLAGFKIYIFDS